MGESCVISLSTLPYSLSLWTLELRGGIRGVWHCRALLLNENLRLGVLELPQLLIDHYSSTTGPESLDKALHTRSILLYTASLSAVKLSV